MKQLNLFCLCYRHASLFMSFIFCKFPETYAFHLCVKYDKTNWILSNKVWNNVRCSVITQVYLFYWIVKSTCFNYRDFDLEDDLVGVSHTWYLSGQSIIALLKLVWRELNMMSMNYWKKKCVGFHRTWVWLRTVWPMQSW